MSYILKQGRHAVIVGYSLLVMATVIPGLHGIPSVALVPYYLFVPGYSFSLFLSDARGFLKRISYSFILSMTILLTVDALAGESLVSSSFPFSVSLPLLSIAASTYAYYSR